MQNGGAQKVKRSGYDGVDSHGKKCIQVHDRNPALRSTLPFGGVAVRPCKARIALLQAPEIIIHDLVAAYPGNSERCNGHPNRGRGEGRSEEHTSELQSRENIVCS